MAKDPGRKAYEAHVRKNPLYNNGRPRPTWDQIGEVAQASWRRNTREKLDAGK